MSPLRWMSVCCFVVCGWCAGDSFHQQAQAHLEALRKTLDLLETLQGSDNVHIFPEKLYDNEDNLHSPENKVYSPKELMEMDWLDACVHGKLPHYDELDVKTRTVLAINGLDNVKGLEK